MPVDELLESLRLATIEFREKRGWSQVETARRAGMGQPDYNKLERGARGFGLMSLLRVSCAFGLPAHFLLYYAETGRYFPKTPAPDMGQIRQLVSIELERGRPDLEHLSPNHQRDVVAYELGRLEATLHVDRFMSGDLSIDPNYQEPE